MATAGNPSIYVRYPQDIEMHDDGSMSCAADLATSQLGGGDLSFDLKYTSDMVADQYLTKLLPANVSLTADIDISPGFSGTRLPLPDDIMPTAIAWRPNGRLVFTSFKGQVYEATDADHDGLEGDATVLCDGLATPYGVWASNEVVDVITKSATRATGRCANRRRSLGE